MPDRHDKRRRALGAVLRARQAEVALVTDLVNVRYLSGFTGSNGAVMVRPDGDAVLATDGRYRTQAAQEAPDLEVVVEKSVATALVARAAADGARRIGVEDHVVTLEAAELLRGAAGDAELVALGRAVESLRAVKDDVELDLLRRACAAADTALLDVLETVRAGDTERDVAWRLAQRLHELGTDGPSFDTIVAAGPNSAIPHHRPTDRPLERGDLLKIDFGALVEGYHSDMTRVAVLGQAAQWQRDLHALVAEAQAAGLREVRPGAVPKHADAAARAVIEAAGEQLPHGLGHGVGLQIHEAPMLAVVEEPLVPGITVTVEPGVYLPGRGGVRIEDIVAVTTSGQERLTNAPSALLEL